MKRIENNLEQQMWFKALAPHLPEEVYHQVKDELLKWVKDNFVPLDAVVKYEIADDVEKLKELWYARNPAHEVETGTGEDMFWKTVLMIIKEYNNR